MVCMDVLNERHASSIPQYVYRHDGCIESTYSAMNGRASNMTERILEGIER